MSAINASLITKVPVWGSRTDADGARHLGEGETRLAH